MVPLVLTGAGDGAGALAVLVAAVPLPRGPGYRHPAFTPSGLSYTLPHIQDTDIRLSSS